MGVIVGFFVSRMSAKWVGGQDEEDFHRRRVDFPRVGRLRWRHHGRDDAYRVSGSAERCHNLRSRWDSIGDKELSSHSVLFSFATKEKLKSDTFSFSTSSFVIPAIAKSFSRFCFLIS